MKGENVWVGKCGGGEGLSQRGAEEQVLGERNVDAPARSLGSGRMAGACRQAG